MDGERVRIERKDIELTGSTIAFLHGKVAEWNASSYAATGMLDGLGAKTQPIDFRSGQLMAQLQRWSVCGEDGQRPLIFLGTPHTGQEVRTPRHRLKTLQPPIGVLVTPSASAEFRISGPVWTQHFWKYSASVGDVLGGSWNVSYAHENRLRFRRCDTRMEWRWQPSLKTSRKKRRMARPGRHAGTISRISWD